MILKDKVLFYVHCPHWSLVNVYIMSITCTDYCEQYNMFDKPFKFCMHSEHRVCNSECKLTIHNILLVY